MGNNFGLIKVDAANIVDGSITTPKFNALAVAPDSALLNGKSVILANTRDVNAGIITVTSTQTLLLSMPSRQFYVGDYILIFVYYRGQKGGSTGNITTHVDFGGTAAYDWLFDPTDEIVNRTVESGFYDANLNCIPLKITSDGLLVIYLRMTSYNSDFTVGAGDADIIVDKIIG